MRLVFPKPHGLTLVNHRWLRSCMLTSKVSRLKYTLKGKYPEPDVCVQVQLAGVSRDLESEACHAIWCWRPHFDNGSVTRE